MDSMWVMLWKDVLFKYGYSYMVLSLNILIYY
nr:MAG TPA: hypothetical protein [Bacteriophage sp.]